MQIEFLSNKSQVKPKGLVCVIDVIRAFTTAAYAFGAGAERIILAKSKEEAFELKKENPDFLLMGEYGGLIIDGFDFGNSPVDISKVDLTGKTLVHKTTYGTDGIKNNFQADELIAASFPNAEATYNYIKNSGCEHVSFIVTNSYKSAEDVAFANYISEKLLSNPNIRPESFLANVRDAFYVVKEGSAVSKEDLEFATDLDKFNFVMKAGQEDGLTVLRKVEL